MKTYTPVEVRNELGIQDSTLRKYSLLLEQEGVAFERHKNNRRIYTELHVKTLKRSIELKKDADMTLEDAVIEAVKEIKAHPIVESDNVTDIALQRHDSDVSALLKEIESLREIIVEQENKQKERDTLFLEVLEDLQSEVTKLREEREEAKLLELESAKEEVQEEDPPRGIFGKWFRKKK